MHDSVNAWLEFELTHLASDVVGYTVVIWIDHVIRIKMHFKYTVNMGYQVTSIKQSFTKGTKGNLWSNNLFYSWNLANCFTTRSYAACFTHHGVLQLDLDRFWDPNALLSFLDTSKPLQLFSLVEKRNTMREWGIDITMKHSILEMYVIFNRVAKIS